MVGGGVFGNLQTWILDAIEEAITELKDEPLDVFLVHYSPISKENRFVELERKLKQILKTSRRKTDDVTSRR